MITGNPLAACSVYGDLTYSVHTVNNLCMFNCQLISTFVIEDHMLDWHSCQICYPLEIKILLLSLLLQKLCEKGNYHLGEQRMFRQSRQSLRSSAAHTIYGARGSFRQRPTSLTLLSDCACLFEGIRITRSKSPGSIT